MNLSNKNIDALIASLAARSGLVNVDQLVEVLDSSGRDLPVSRVLAESSLLSPHGCELLASLAREIVAEQGSVQSGLEQIGLDPRLSSLFVPAAETEPAGQTDSVRIRGSESSISEGKPKPRSEDDLSPAESEATMPRYEVRRFLAKGGIGRVSIALDKQLNREVAFKEIRRDRRNDTKNRRRFLVEAEVTGRLEHPGIVPIYSRGTGDLNVLWQKVLDRDIVSPRRNNPQLPVTLEAIAMKAMSPKSGDRYASARVLAEDVEAFLADEPVTALADPWWQRVKRWLRRHPAIASGGLATVGLTLLGLTVGLLVVGGLNRQLDRANTNLTTANETAVAARDRAEKNLEVAKQSVEKYLLQFANNPALQAPNFNEFRSKLLKTAIPFYFELQGFQSFRAKLNE